MSLTFTFEYVSSDLRLRVCNISKILNGPWLIKNELDIDAFTKAFLK
jgi:hypothetical protein